MDAPREELSTLVAEVVRAVDADPVATFAMALGFLVGAVEDAARTTPGTAEHSFACVCWSCKLRIALDGYWAWVRANDRYFPDAPVLS